MPAGISCSPLGESSGCRGVGVIRRLDPKEDRVRNQTGSEGPAGGTWLRQREPPGAQTPQSGLYEQPAHTLHTAHIPACRDREGGRRGTEGGKRVNPSPSPSLTPCLPDLFTGRVTRVAWFPHPHPRRKTSTHCVCGWCACQQRWVGKRGLGESEGTQRRPRWSPAASTQVMTGPDLGVGVGGPPTPTSEFSAAFHGEGAQGWGGVGSSTSSQQLSTPTPPHPVSLLLDGAVWRAGKREDTTGGCGFLLPSCPREPLWLAPSGAAPEAPSPSGSRGPPRQPPGSAGLPSCKWTAGTGYRDCRSSDLPRDTG